MQKCFLSSFLLGTFPGMAKVAVDQKGSRKLRNSLAGGWGPNFSIPGTLRLLPSVLRASTGVSASGQLGLGQLFFSRRLRTRNLPSQLSLLRRPLPLSLKAKGSDVLLPLLLLFGAFSQEAGVTRSS